MSVCLVCRVQGRNWPKEGRGKRDTGQNGDCRNGERRRDVDFRAENYETEEAKRGGGLIILHRIEN